MSWDEYTETKDIEGIGSAEVITRMDDWNRTEISVSLDSDNFHVESRYVRHHHESNKNFYAVPNGMTINHSLNLPEIVFQSFQEKLCHKYSKDSLIEFLRLLEGKRAKFEYPIRRRNKLEPIAEDYYRHYKKMNRFDCSEKVLEAIEMYDNYQYNYSKFYELKRKAEREKNELDSGVLALCTEIF